MLESRDADRFNKCRVICCFVKGQIQPELIAEFISCKDQMMGKGVMKPLHLVPLTGQGPVVNM